MTDYEEYLKHCIAYDNELGHFLGVEQGNRNIGAIKTYYRGLIENCTVINLHKENQYAGFLILRPLAEEDAGFHIEESYTLPVFRNQGLMSNAVKEAIKNHKEQYSIEPIVTYEVIRHNTKANKFWKKLFQSMGYKRDLMFSDNDFYHYAEIKKER